jgi:protein-disulfide isomerase
MSSSSLGRFVLSTVALAAFFGAGYVSGNRPAAEIMARLSVLEARVGIKPPVEAPREIVLQPGRTIGSESAPIALVVYTDFQCPHCIAFHRGAFETFKKDYVDTGKVKFSVKFLPLGQIHPFAESTAVAADCAATRGRFYELYDGFLSHADLLSEQGIHSLVKQAGLSQEDLEECTADSTDRVMADVDEAKRLGFSGTPAFVAGLVDRKGKVKVGQRWSGTRDAEELAQIVEKLLGEFR